MNQSGERSKSDLHRRWFEECFNKRRVELVEQLCTPDHQLHYLSASPELDPAGPIRSLVELYTSACPDFHVKINDQMVASDRVITRLTVLGTQHGQMGPFPPSHLPFKTSAVEIVRVEGDRIAETWHYIDVLAVLVATKAVEVVIRPDVPGPPEVAPVLSPT